VRAEGRLVTYPGAEVVIATELAGLIVRLPVQEKSVVRKGDLIAELKSDELQAWRAEAHARIEEAGADIRFFEREVQRTRGLISRRAASDVAIFPRAAVALALHFVEIDGRRLVADRDVDLGHRSGVIGDLIVAPPVEPLLFQELCAEHGDHVVECN
jgi:multidrug resistance efflux pump